jgi:DNA repair exonuclease SbcCD ATPase subunit
MEFKEGKNSVRVYIERLKMRLSDKDEMIAELRVANSKYQKALINAAKQIEKLENEVDQLMLRKELVDKWTELKNTTCPLQANPNDESCPTCKQPLPLEDRQKMLWVKQQHPHIKIYFIFGKGSNKITKRSKTSYIDWAHENGFEAIDVTQPIPRGWLK